MLRLLFILPDLNNEKILVIKETAKDHAIPEFNQLVSENAGFEIPHLFNEYFYKLTEIPVYRKYVFTHENYCVFVLEQREEIIQLNDGCSWVLYDNSSLNKDKIISDILHSVRYNYNKSINMPWIKNGFTPYIEWINKMAVTKNFRITGEIKQIKNAYVSNVFEIPTNIGNLYQKTPCAIYITELPFTKELLKWNITKLPTWLDYDSELNTILMKDMGGYNLPENSNLTVLKEVIRKYSNIQKNSVKYIQKSSAPYKDLRINKILFEIDSLPNKIAGILNKTENQLNEFEIEKFKNNLVKAKSLLESLNSTDIPDVIQHGDLRHGNIRIIPIGYMFYDWAWAGISHPFISISHFLHVIRRTLPANVPAKDILVDYYLNEWNNYGSFEQNKEEFLVLDKLKELFMVYEDFQWVCNIFNASEEKIEKISADGWLLERRLYYFCLVLKRFIEADI